MDKAERMQVRLLLDHLRDECLTEASARNKAMHSEHAAKGLLQSGATVKASLRIAKDLIRNFVKQACAEVADVAQDIEAFNMIVAEVETVLNDLKSNLNPAVKLASGGTRPGSSKSVALKAGRRFVDLQRSTRGLIGIHRFSFTCPAPSRMAEWARVANTAQQPEASPLAKNKGGKPLAAHWDEMWAEIAVQLWLGDLKPAKQGDITKAMLDWFAARNVDVGETAVTERARQLWRKIEPEL